MLPYLKILCPTDFSEPSYEGLAVASELAIHFSAQLILVHVVTPLPAIPGAPAPTGFHIPAVLAELEESAKESFERIVRERIPAELISKGLVDKRVVQGDPTGEIVRIAGEEYTDVIVIATHGLTGWRRFIFGSVAEKVVRLAECPVLTVPVSHGASE